MSSQHISQAELEALKERRTLEKKTHNMVKEVILHCLVLLMFLIIGYLNQDPRVYRQNEHIRQTFELDTTVVRERAHFANQNLQNFYTIIYANSIHDVSKMYNVFR